MLPNHCRRKQVREWGIDICEGQLNRILIEEKDSYHAEKMEMLRVGLEVSGYVNTDDTTTATEGAVLGSLLAHGVAADLGIISDGAFQFKLLSHGLCWVHAPAHY